MKQAINGVIYDTEKATVLARTDDDDSFHDCDLCRTTLYKTENDNYFKSTEPAFFKELRKITPLEVHEAVLEYNKLPVKLVDFKQAFPEKRHFIDA